MGGTRRAFRLVVCAAALGLPARAAMAEAARVRVAVIAVEVSGEIPDAVSGALAASVASGLAASGFEVVPLAAAAPALVGSTLGSCRAGPCVAEASRLLGVDLVCIAFALRDGDSYATTLALVDGASGTVVARTEETCELCGTAHLVEAVAIAASALRAKLAAPVGPGTTKARRSEAVTGAARFAAAAARAGEPPASARRRGAAAGALVLAAAGLAAVGVGAWLLALDGRGTCAPGDPVYPGDPAGEITYPTPGSTDGYVCRHVYRTMRPGAAAVGGGAAALLGATLWLVVLRW